MPPAAPTPICIRKVQISSTDRLASPASTKAMSVTVRKMAIGSFSPDSTTIVWVTLPRSRMPRPWSSRKVAAASVEPTTDPSNSATSSGTPRSQTASPTTAAVIATPTVASASAGRQLTLMPRTLVPSPPTNRITANARLPTSWANAKSSNKMPPKPSSPPSIPMPRNTSRIGAPSRPASGLTTTLRRIRPPSANSARSKVALRVTPPLRRRTAVRGMLPGSNVSSRERAALT
jgi:hypothetical protein